MKRLTHLLLCGAIACAAPGPLSIVNAGATHMEDGPALPPDFEFRPGETVYVSFQVSGFQATGNKVRIRYQVEALDPRNVKVVEAMSGAVDAEVLPEDKDWLPKVRKTVDIPPLAGSGLYQLAISVTDEPSGRTASKEISFPVRGSPVAESGVLAIRNFGFSRAEDDRTALAVPAYRPGDAVWVHFDLTGYKTGPANRFEVDYQVSVTGPGGKLLYTQAEPTAEQRAPFYPQRYVPAEFSLSLARDARPGEYGLIIVARDKVAGQTLEERRVFRVE